MHDRGHSFKGAAAYLLHDKDADTSMRVAWTLTRNLTTDDADLAWRLMAATAMDQNRLKQQAGIKNTGRKSNAHVQHFSLSWHPSEGVDGPAMVAAAEAAIAALGASDRQAIIVCHDDEPQPHVHILMNRVSPLDGRMLPSSKEKLKLSAWAEQYEKDRGQVWCDQRVINNAARRRGEFTRGTPAKARNVYEQELQRPVNDNNGQTIRAEQRQKDAELSARGRQLEHKHKGEWERLEYQHKQRMASIRDDTKTAIGRATQRVRDSYRPRWAELYHQHRADQADFSRRETSLLGRVQNRFKSIDFRGIVVGDEKGRAIGQAFDAITSRDGRQMAQDRQQREADAELAREQKTAETAAVEKLRHQERQRLQHNRMRFKAERMELILSRRMDQARHRAEWLERNKDREQAHRHEPVMAAEQDNVQRSKQIQQHKSLSQKRAERKRNKKRERDDKDRGR